MTLPPSVTEFRECFYASARRSSFFFYVQPRRNEGCGCINSLQAARKGCGIGRRFARAFFGWLGRRFVVKRIPHPVSQ